MYFDGLLSGHERKEWKQSYLHLFSSSRVLPPLRSPSEFFRSPSLSLGISYRGALIASSEVRTLQLVSDSVLPWLSSAQFSSAASPDRVCFPGDSIRSAANPSDSGVHAPPTDSQSAAATQIAG